jgi:protein TonB
MSASAADPGLVHTLRRERALLWGVLASIALHALVLLGISAREAPAPSEKSLLVLTARLAPVARASREPPPDRPRAEPPSEPAPALRPPREPERKKPALVPAPVVQKTVPAEAAKPAPVEPALEAAAPASSAPSSVPAGPTQARTAPQALAGPRTGATDRPGNEMDAGTMEQYRLALIVATRRYKRYPAIAMEKGWQGRVEVRMVIGANGMLASTSIKTSSGHEILDNQAMDMLKKGKTTVQIPAGLRGREFSIDVPVIFNLDNPGS